MTPTNIHFSREKQRLSLEYEDANFELTAEFLRVHSPSAEVQGHSPEQAVLQVGKRHVRIKDIEPVGHYAIKFYFDDGHDSGLYTWAYLYKLGSEKEALWDTYLENLSAANASRESL